MYWHKHLEFNFNGQWSPIKEDNLKKYANNEAVSFKKMGFSLVKEG